MRHVTKLCRFPARHANSTIVQFRCVTFDESFLVAKLHQFVFFSYNGWICFVHFQWLSFLLFTRHAQDSSICRCSQGQNGNVNILDLVLLDTLSGRQSLRKRVLQEVRTRYWKQKNQGNAFADKRI